MIFIVKDEHDEARDRVSLSPLTRIDQRLTRIAPDYRSTRHESSHESSDRERRGGRDRY